MRTLREMLDLMDPGVEHILFHRLLDKERFMQLVESEELYNCLHKSKAGLIKISYLNGSNKHNGFTAAFGEGIACRMSNDKNWYSTSTIKSINWEDKTFETLNNIYKFDFQEVPIDEALQWANEFYEKHFGKNESKSKETE